MKKKKRTLHLETCFQLQFCMSDKASVAQDALLENSRRCRWLMQARIDAPQTIFHYDYNYNRGPVYCSALHCELWGFGAGMRCGAGTVEIEERYPQTNFHCVLAVSGFVVG